MTALFSPRAAAFNAGLLVLNLRVWRAQRVVTQLERLVPRMRALGLASYRGMAVRDRRGGVSVPADSSQTPLLILFGTSFERLPPKWNVNGLGWNAKVSPDELSGSCALHWSGGHKPWLPKPGGWYTQWWEPAHLGARAIGLDSGTWNVR